MKNFKLTTTTVIIVIFLSLLALVCNHSDAYGHYVLERRIRASDVNYVEDYLNHGGDPNYVFRERLKSAQSLLGIATKKSDIAMVEVLLAKGADPNHLYAEKIYSPFIDAINVLPQTSKSREILKKFRDGFTILSQNCNGDTPLHWAYRYGDDKTIKILEGHPEFSLAAGVRNKLGETPMDIQSSRASKESAGQYPRSD